MKSIQKKNVRGFSTAEVLLSIFVVSIGLVTIMSVMSASLRRSLRNRDVVIATDLAQEGVELVRNVRDNHFASGGDGFDSPAVFNNFRRHCRIDWNDPDNSLDCQLVQGVLSRYYLSYANGLYAHSGAGAAQERYARYIFIDYDSAGGERAMVRSFVLWGNAALPPVNGSSAGCTVESSCVFSETFLTAWK